eukprot:SAG31_NODE_36565_length_312_cov_0.732394_1_plen_103_part_11
MCMDTNVLCRELSTATASRIFFHSCRKQRTPEEDGSIVISWHDPIDPHLFRNQVHVYEFIEAVIRVANEKFQTKARTVNERLAMLLKTGTFGPLADAAKLSSE